MADTTPSQDLIEAITSSRDAYFGHRGHLQRTAESERLFAEAFTLGADFALDAPQPNAAADGWISVNDALPSCDGEAVYIGENSSGHIACFNEFDGMSNCFMVTPDENTHVLSELVAWQRVHRRAPPTLNASKEARHV